MISDRSVRDHSVRVLVADDEPLSEALATRTIEVDPRLSVVARCENGTGVVEALSAGAIDVAVLDIRMPGLDGLALARFMARSEDRPEIVFVTAFPEHAVEAFGLDVCDYVTKPYDPDRLRRAVLKAASKRQLRNHPSTLQPMERLIVRTRGGTRLVAFSEIEAIDADEKEVWLRVGSVRLRYPGRISAMENALPCPPFVRVHRSHIVNMDWIAHMSDDSSGTGEITLRSGTTIPISRRYRRRLSALFLLGR